MKKHLKRIISYVLITALIAFGRAMASFAEDAPDKNISVSIKVTERNGVKVDSYLIKRGVPFAKGEVLPDQSFALELNGEQLPLQTKPLELYNDGSVKWLLAAFTVDLQPGETREYTLVNKKSDDIENPVMLTKDGQNIEMSNGILTVDLSGFGINNVSYKNNEILQGNGTEVWAVQGGKFPLKTGSIEIVDEGPVYSTVKIKGRIANLNIDSEQRITLVKGSDEILQDITFSAKAGNTTISSIGESFLLSDKFSESFHETTKYISGDYNPLLSCGYMGAYSRDDNLSVAVISRDVERFRGAITPEVSNGFVWDRWEHSIGFAPIQYDAPYNWFDGLTRTTHCVIKLKKGKITDYSGELDTMKNTPLVQVSPQQFVEAGIIMSDYTNPVSQRQVQAIVSAKDKRDGRFDAGAIPFALDEERNVYSNFNVRPGETEYNLWYANILADNGDFFDIVNESTESWADINIYRGKSDFAYGATRYRNAFDYSNFFSCHPYYGDTSGLYMGYVMTGNEYFKDCLKLTSDFYVRSAKTNISCGFEIPTNLNWINLPNISRSAGTEIRFMILSRAMLYSYNLFGNEEYKKVADDFCKWAEYLQTDGGWWYQSVTPDGTPWYTVEGARTSNYVMLYGARGLCEYYRQTKDEKLFVTLKRFADYLISEFETGHNSWMFDPVGNAAISEINGDGARGNAPMQEIMSAEIFETVYNGCMDEKYLEGMLKAVRYFVASTQRSGLAPQRYNLPEYAGGKINSVIVAQNVTYSRIAPDLAYIIKNNIQTVKELGYADIACLLLGSTEDISQTIENPFDSLEVTINAYQSDDAVYLYIVNHSGKNSGAWEKELDLKVSGGTSIYKGIKNKITPTETRLTGLLKQFDLYMAEKIPVSISSQSDTVTVNDAQYNENEIVLDLSSPGSFTIEASNGDFEVSDAEKYSVSIENAGQNNVKIYIRKSETGNYLSNNGKISVSLPNASELTMFSDVYGHWAANDITSMQSAGIVKGTGDNLFEPDKTITAGNFAGMLLRAAGEDESYAAALKLGMLNADISPSAYITREEMVHAAVSLLENKTDIKSDGIVEKEVILPAHYEDDKAAVKKEAETLAIYKSKYISGDIELPAQGIFGCDIEWRSSDENVITSDGKVTRPDAADGNGKAVLTAVCKRNGQSAERNFDIEVLNSSYVDYMSRNDYIKGTIMLQGSSNKEFEVEVNIKQDKANVIVGHIDTHTNKVSAVNHQSVPIIVRFNPEGYLDAYNTDKYMAESVIEYTAGDRFLFKYSVDIENKKYSVTAVKNGTEEYAVAKDYGFRKAAQLPEVINAITLVGDNDDSLTLLRHSDIKSSLTENIKTEAPESIYLTGNFDASGYGDKLVWCSSSAEYITNGGIVLKYPVNEDKKVVMYGTKALFNDIGSVSEQYKGSVIKGNALSLVKGNNGNFYPEATATRAEATVITRRFAELLNKFR